ncbi:MAG: YciI family protein [Vicingaceae bacterium]
MKFSSFSHLFVFILFYSCQVDHPKEAISLKEAKVQHKAEKGKVSYDSTKAKTLGADDYGMKPYVMAFLKSGPNRPTDSAHAADLQRAHLDNINRLAEEGKLVLAGPFYGNKKDSLRGIYIFDVESLEAARALTETDPAIQYGSLKMELKKWYGSAALMEVNEIHQTLAKIDI